MTVTHGFIATEPFHPFKVQLYVREDEELPQLPRRQGPFHRAPLQALVEGALPGHLTEVVFPPDRDPSDFIKKVIAGFADDHVGVVVLDHGGNGRLPVKRLSHDHPMRDDTRTVVLVVDASLAYGIADCFLRIDENTGAISSGPLIPKIDFWKRADNRPHVWKGIAWLLAGHLERIRSTNRVDAGSRSRVVKVSRARRA